jgi:hypothetical protein
MRPALAVIASLMFGVAWSPAMTSGVRLAISFDCVAGTVTLAVPIGADAVTAVEFRAGTLRRTDTARPFRHTFVSKRFGRRFTAEAVVRFASGERRTLRQLVRNCPAPTGAAARLSTSQTCRNRSLVTVSVERIRGPAIRSTTFFVGAKRIIDQTAPFSRRVATGNLPSRFVVRADITFVSGTRISLMRTADNCR